MRIPIQFAGPTFTARSPRANAALTVNMSPSVTTAGSIEQVVLYSLPGLKPEVVVGVGPHRGAPIKFGNSAFTVSGGDFYEVDVNNSATIRGSLSTTAGRVRMAKNFTQIMVVDGFHGYIWDGMTFQKITDPDFPANPIDVSFLDGYFIVVSGGTNRFYISNLNTGLAWDQLDYSLAQADSDNLMGCPATRGDVWLIGEDTLEIFYDSGDADFPLKRIPGYVFDYGCEATHSITTLDSNPIWLSRTPKGGRQIVAAEGRSPVILSTPDLDWQLSRLSVVSDAFAYTYTHAGESHYVITFPYENKTFSCNLKTKWWSERWAPDDGAHWAAGSVYLNSKHLVASRIDGSFYSFDFGTHTDGGQLRRRIRRASAFHKEGKKISHGRLEVVVEAGVGAISGDYQNPVVNLRYSDDDGSTWSSYLPQPLGRAGQRFTRVAWNQLGSSYYRVYELSCQFPVDFSIFESFLDYEIEP